MLFADIHHVTKKRNINESSVVKNSDTGFRTPGQLPTRSRILECWVTRPREIPRVKLRTQASRMNPTKSIRIYADAIGLPEVLPTTMELPLENMHAKNRRQHSSDSAPHHLQPLHFLFYAIVCSKPSRRGPYNYMLATSVER